MEAAAPQPLQALRAVSARLEASAAEQQALARAAALCHHRGGGGDGAELSGAAAELLAALREAGAAGGSDGDGGGGTVPAAAADAAREAAAHAARTREELQQAATAAEESKRKAVEQVKAKAKAGFIKLKAEAELAREELGRAREELEREQLGRQQLEGAAERASEQDARLRVELAGAEAREAAVREEGAAAVSEVKVKARDRFVAMQAQHDEQAKLVESLRAKLQAETTTQHELREVSRRQEAEGAATQSAATAAASELQSCLQEARHELQQAQHARDAALAGRDTDAALASRLETECESLRQQQAADAALRERIAAEHGDAENQNRELAAEVNALKTERQQAQAAAAGRDQERAKSSVLEEECEARRAELASKQKKIKSLQREVKRLEQLASCSPAKDAPASMDGIAGGTPRVQGQRHGHSTRAGDDITNTPTPTLVAAEAASSLSLQLRREVRSLTVHQPPP
jgi:hypothetical protein